MAGGALRGIRGGIRVVRLRLQESLAELG